ncbi:MAG: phosphotransferase [Chloroflexi bacterium]|nr:phosphotransferase [Chloroflexota bacterium]
MIRPVEANPLIALRSFPVQAPSILGRDKVGNINDNWLVTDAGSKRYMLRAYRRVRDAERIAFQLAFQEHLLAAGFPTAPVVRTQDGETSASVEGLQWALFEFVEGQEFDFTRSAQAREAGKRLAEFETVAAGYRGPVVAPPMEEVDLEKWLAPVSIHVWRVSVLATEQEEQLDKLFAGRGCGRELGYFRHWRREAAEAWPEDRLSALPHTWLHCDYHGRNMVFQGDRLAGLFDFDFVTHGPRTFDVSRSLFNFGRERGGSTVLREEFCRAFLEGYESLQPLSDEERQALPFMAALNWVPDAGFYAARRMETGDPDIDKRLRDDVRMMQAMQAEMHRLAPQFGWNEL